MNRTTSTYLDAVRLSAAVLVFLGHLSTSGNSGGLLWQLSGLASPAVDVFFVLSGFVIAYASSRPGMTGLAYGLDRASRVLSVSVPALVVTLAVAWLSPGGMYTTTGSGYTVWTQLMTSALFLNEGWFGHIRMPLNSPYWSLCYEVWYYAIFGVAVFAPGRMRWVGATVVLVIAGPSIAILFPLWLMGVATYRLCLRQAIGPWVGICLLAGSLGGTCLYIGWACAHGGVPVLPPIYDRTSGQVIADYLVGGLFALSILGAHAAGPLLDGICRPWAKPIGAAASVTFTLYMIHIPVIAACRILVPWPAGSVANRVLIIGAVLTASVALAWVTELRRKQLRHWLVALVSWVSGKSLRPS